MSNPEKGAVSVAASSRFVEDLAGCLATPTNGEVCAGGGAAAAILRGVAGASWSAAELID